MSTNHDEAGGSTAVEPVTNEEIERWCASIGTQHSFDRVEAPAFIRRLAAERSALDADFTAFAEQQRGLNQELIKLEAERDALQVQAQRLRQKLFGGRRSEGTTHTTACSIWGEDGRGNADGFDGPLPCNCHALVNFTEAKRDALREQVTLQSDRYASALDSLQSTEIELHKAEQANRELRKALGDIRHGLFQPADEVQAAIRKRCSDVLLATTPPEASAESEPMGSALSEVAAEIKRAREKFPGNQHMLAALMEEVGELAQQLLDDYRDNGPRPISTDARAEAMQVACVAVRIMEEGSQEFSANEVDHE